MSLDISAKLWDVLRNCNVMAPIIPQITELSAKNREKRLLLGNTGKKRKKALNKKLGFSSLTFNNGCHVRYHRDTNDHPNTYATCVVLYEKCSRPCPESEKEGLVVLPEYEIAFQLSHGDCYFLKV
jgi:hypothetical protein